MWLEPQRALLLKGANGFLVSKNPGNHPKHQGQLLSRMPVAEELAKATDAAAEAAGLTADSGRWAIGAGLTRATLLLLV